jgi:hypothetical protein
MPAAVTTTTGTLLAGTAGFYADSATIFLAAAILEPMRPSRRL